MSAAPDRTHTGPRTRFQNGLQFGGQQQVNGQVRLHVWQRDVLTRLATVFTDLLLHLNSKKNRQINASLDHEAPSSVVQVFLANSRHCSSVWRHPAHDVQGVPHSDPKQGWQQLHADNSLLSQWYGMLCSEYCIWVIVKSRQLGIIMHLVLKHFVQHKLCSVFFAQQSNKKKEIFTSLYGFLKNL